MSPLSPDQEARRNQLANLRPGGERECSVCGETFKPRVRRQHCCSPACSREHSKRYMREYGKKRKPRKVVEAPCVVCGELFTSDGRRRCCSPTCQRERTRQRKQAYDRRQGHSPEPWRTWPLDERFMRHVHKTQNCWEWTGYKDTKGYGYLRVDGRTRAAQRISFELHVGEIPANHHIDHLCRNPACVNPDHLEAVEPEENYRRQSLSAEAHLALAA